MRSTRGSAVASATRAWCEKRPPHRQRRGKDGRTFVYSANDVAIVLPGNIGAELSDAGDFFRDALRELKRSLATFFVLNRSVDSVNLLRVFIEEFPEAGKLIAVRNRFFGDADRFTRWNESKTRQAFLNGGRRISLWRIVVL